MTMTQEQQEAAWATLTDARYQTSNWDLTQTVSQQTIQEIADEVHRRSPCKQNRVHYGMKFVDWNDTELRNAIYDICVDRDAPTHKYNAQTLGNWICVFTGRVPAPFQLDFTNVPDDILDLGLSNIEIGLAAHALIYGARIRGLQTGFCRCIDWDYTAGWDIVTDRLGLTSKYEVSVIVGIGHVSDNLTQTYNPHTQQWVNSYKDQGEKWQLEPKPAQSEYIEYFTASGSGVDAPE
jgi:hypothetical protein